MRGGRLDVTDGANRTYGGFGGAPTYLKSDGDACHEHRDARPCEHRGRIRLHTVR